MKIHYGFDHLPPITRPIVAVGSFDGLHAGHRMLIDKLGDVASRCGGESVIVTFDQHPRQVLRGDNRLLTTLAEKLLLLEQTSLDHVIVIHFTREFSLISSEEFTSEYLLGRLGAKEVISGQEHHFGHNRAGNRTTLDMRGIQTDTIERYRDISSTNIRAAIEAGDMVAATKMLGAPYLILTDQRDDTKLLPPPGVYRAIVDGQATEIEINQTIFDIPGRKIEIVG